MPLRPDDVLAVDISSAGQTAGIGSAGKYYYLKDQLGSVTEVTNPSGQVVQSYDYSVFGKIYAVKDGSGADITSSPIINTGFTYTGREYDQETGMYYYRARYYDASVGRFLQQDPDPGKLANPSTFLSRYVYTGNNPVMANDPSGKVWFLTIPLMFAAGGAISSAIFAAASGADFSQILSAAGSGAFYGLLTGAIVVGGMAAGMALTGASIGSSTIALSGGIAGGLAGAAIGAHNNPANPAVGALSGFVFGFIGGFIAGAGYLTPGVDITQSTVFNSPPLNNGFPSTPPVVAPPPSVPILPVPAPMPPAAPMMPRLPDPILVPRG